VIRAVRFFLSGSAGRPGRVRPQHMLEMVSYRKAGLELRSAKTGFDNHLLYGHIHPKVSLILFGGNLIALEKKSSGKLPTAVGYNLRRIAAKCANSYATNQLAGYFSPIQLGVGTLGGFEAAVLATIDASSKRCRMGTWSRSSISATPSTACTEIRCYAQCIQQSRASTDSAIFATAINLS